ncbi:LysM peptidoglycan-binding domain-containing protein [Heliobacterium gestii]|uniref:LysM peptidoglycan-binding domain-containing protein n=1 Tax=Heliomicrobium gestii TaxID=2699 RepID=A0A845LIB6_HELGE|nr:LysM peptidoglycan-binding domain-containing protein [Heliomicrobium gestii]MBM7868043.1 nucleoid-associated protein YgaU [Heliomicrobium gestii]MZP44309.1 LysM peptidoglycan-binding domain-containing protein [Heliomicrobium gestii]
MVQKAKIIVHGSKSDTEFEVLFNPNEYTLDAQNTYQKKAANGSSAPIVQFTAGDQTTLTMELFYDTTDKGTDVREETNKVTQLLDVDPDLHHPPICSFVWGSLNFKGLLKSVGPRYTMFLNDGTPVRARLRVTFWSWEGLTKQYQRIPRQSADRTKERQVKSGEPLWLIAHEEYDDPSQWRKIAEANGIDDPRALEPGQKLIVPKLR